MTAILLALVLTQAQPKLASNGWHWVKPEIYSGPVFDYCRNGGDCRVRDLTVASNLTISPGDGAGGVAVTIPNFHYVFYGSACWTYANGSQFIIANSSCQTSINGKVVIGSSANLNFDGNKANATLFDAPSTFGIGLAGEGASGTFFQSNLANWRPLQSGQHELLDRKTYVFGWKAATPSWEQDGLIDDTFTGVTQTEACVAGTVANTAAMPMADASLGSGRVGFGRSFTTQAALNATCGDSNTAWTKWSNTNPRMCFYIRTDSAAVTTTRIIVGMGVNTIFTAPADTPTTTGAWFRYSTNASDTTWQACSSDGVSAATCSNTSVSVAANTSYLMCIDGTVSGVILYWVNGQARVRRTTNLPGSTSIGSGAVVQALAASARTITMSRRTFDVTR